MSFGKNRSGVPYLKSDMLRVLLPGGAWHHVCSGETGGLERFSGDYRNCNG
jgi:hypothetical protein